jgi:hypothetical protein
MENLKSFVYSFDLIGITGYGQFTIKKNGADGTPFYVVPLAMAMSDDNRRFRKYQAERKARFVCDMLEEIKKSNPKLLEDFNKDMELTFAEWKEIDNR